MKRFHKLSGLILALGMAIGLAGCAKAPGQSGLLGGGTVIGQALSDSNRVARLVRVSERAAYLGTRIYLMANPQDRPAFVAARTALVALADANNFDPAAFAAALKGLPIRKLQGDEGSLLVEGAVFLWDEMIQGASVIDKQLVVAQVMGAVIKGFDRALGPGGLTQEGAMGNGQWAMGK